MKTQSFGNGSHSQKLDTSASIYSAKGDSPRFWIKHSLWMVLTFILSLLGVLATPIHGADVNVLIVGTTADTGQSFYPSSGSKAYDISKVKTELEKILLGANMGTVKVQLHNMKTSIFHGAGNNNRLISECFSQVGGTEAPVSSDFWKELRGENGTAWNYVILMDEPYIIEKLPGAYTLGVSEVGKEIEKGTAQAVLFMGWPGNGSASTVDHYKEVVYRTGRSLGYKVVPAGLAWQDLGSVHGTEHPTSNGAYIAAASVYSRIWGVEGGLDKSAADASTYVYDDAMAATVHQTVKTNKGKVQYTGAFVHPNNIFKQIKDSRREWKLAPGINSSQENTFVDGMKDVHKQAGMDVACITQGADSGPDGIYFARNSAIKTTSTVKLNTKYWAPWCGDRSYGYYYYGGDDYIQNGSIWGDYDGDSTPAEFTNLVAHDFLGYMDYSMEQLGRVSSYRHLPQGTLFAQLNKVFPTHGPVSEHGHGSDGWKYTANAYLLTLFSGRCPMLPASGATTILKESSRIGYETAWRMSTLQGRAPGLQVLPSDWKRHRVDPLNSETMTVRFHFKPRANVTVNVATNVTWATVTPQTLTFTPDNYNAPQQVTVTVSAEAANLRGSLFNVVYSTISTGDEVCDKLADSWEYGVNTPPLANSQTVSTLANVSKPIALTSIDPDVVSRIKYDPKFDIPKQNISYSIVQAPTNGSVVLNGNVATYTADNGFAGTDSFTFKVFDGMAYSAVDGTVTIDVLAKGQYNLNLIVNPGAEFGLTGWVGDWSSIFNGPGNIAVGNAHSGGYSFKANGGANAPNTVELYQDVDIRDYSDHINAGKQSFHLSGWGNDKNRDDARLALEFRDINGDLIGDRYTTDRIALDDWKYVETTLVAPPNAVVARVILRGTRLLDSSNLSHFDDLSLIANKPANLAPVAVNPPQASIAMDVPTVIPLSATDADRYPSDVLTYQIVSDPQSGSIAGGEDGFPIYTPNTGFLGTDSFTFRVHDGTVYSDNIATASILVRGNQAPSIVVNSPVMPVSNTIYMCAINGIIFNTTIKDDGGPYLSNVTITWEQISGPHPAVFGSPNSEVTTCHWGDFKVGTYQFRVTASDGQLQTQKDFTVVVLNGGYDDVANAAPQVHTGAPYDPAVVGLPFLLSGNSLYNDKKPIEPGETAIEWVLVSGPGSATFATPSSYETDVIFSAAGNYRLRLTADDGQIKAYEDVIIQVVVPTPPTVNAGNDQTAAMIKLAPPLAGAYFEWDAAKDTPGNATWPSSTNNTYTWTFDGGALSPENISDARFGKLTKAYALPAAKDVTNTTWDALGSTQSATFEFVVDVDTENGLLFESGGATGIQFDVFGGALRGCIKGGGTYNLNYPLTPTDKGRFIHAVFVVTIGNRFELYVDGVLQKWVSIATADWSGNEPAGLGNTTSAAPNSNKVDFTGKLALFRYYKEQALLAAEVATNFESITNDSVVVNLNGVVNEGAVASPALLWSVTNGDASKVTIANASSAVTTARFTQSGTYVLTLTVNDGITQLSDSVTIKINNPSPAQYLTWAEEGFANQFTDKAMDSNPDGDGRNNLMEFAFGTDPTLMDMGPLATDGSRPGDPVISQADEGGFDLYFIRRRDGSLTYTACFSHDLSNFEESNAGLQIVSNINSEYELVKVPFPAALLGGQPARFGCVRVDVSP